MGKKVNKQKTNWGKIDAWSQIAQVIFNFVCNRKIVPTCFARKHHETYETELWYFWFAWRRRGLKWHGNIFFVVVSVAAATSVVCAPIVGNCTECFPFHFRIAKQWTWLWNAFRWSEQLKQSSLSHNAQPYGRPVRSHRFEWWFGTDGCSLHFKHAFPIEFYSLLFWRRWRAWKARMSEQRHCMRHTMWSTCICFEWWKRDNHRFNVYIGTQWDAHCLGCTKFSNCTCTRRLSPWVLCAISLTVSIHLIWTTSNPFNLRLFRFELKVSGWVEPIIFHIFILMLNCQFWSAMDSMPEMISYNFSFLTRFFMCFVFIPFSFRCYFHTSKWAQYSEILWIRIRRNVNSFR